MGAARQETENRERSVHDAVRRTWGYETLRPLQGEAIDAALDERDALIVLPTGGGKSLCYQVPPLVDGKLTLVVSPLIALMKDQADGLRLNGYPAVAMHSGCSPDETREAREALHTGAARLVLVSPERLLSEGFLDWLGSLSNPDGSKGVTRFAIDEAHCISQWGHDFRPEYRRLATLKQRVPGATVHALTATATERVRADIASQLGLADPRVLVGTFDRPNLTYRVLPRVDRDRQIAEVIKRHANEASIVYCLSRRDTEAIADSLTRQGIPAEAYHAGLSTDTRHDVQDRFIREQLDVVCATVAFGMGIDRSNVRCVLHASMPKSVEAYQQETGRAGRDGLDAECVMLYAAGDAMQWSRLIESPSEFEPDPDSVRAQLALLDEMHRFASGMACRHKTLSEHFGQQYPFPNCNACDVCLHEVDRVEDATVVAQKIISCVARTIQASGLTFGAGHIVDVLRGSRAKKIVERGHDQLSTHALLRDTPRPTLVSYVNQLLDLGLLERAGGEYPTLGLSAASREVLKGEREVTLLAPRAPAQARRRTAAESDVELTPEGEALFESLRTVRRRIAEDLSVPPYVVFSDKTLRDIASIRPGTLGALTRARGVGARKAETFGPAFIEHIAGWCEERGLEVDTTEDPTPTIATGPKTVRAAARRKREHEAFARGATVEEVAREEGLAARTVLGHLAEWIETESPASIDAWVTPTEYERVASAIESVGTTFLRPVFEHLGETVPYETIRLVATHLRTRSG